MDGLRDSLPDSFRQADSSRLKTFGTGSEDLLLAALVPDCIREHPRGWGMFNDSQTVSCL
ncbi:MAG: hypothetical protein CME33_27695 [Gimesia sp.]|nr:hypothetical protein [Gimesia sp.]